MSQEILNGVQVSLTIRLIPIDFIISSNEKRVQFVQSPSSTPPLPPILQVPTKSPRGHSNREVQGEEIMGRSSSRG